VKQRRLFRQFPSGPPISVTRIAARNKRNFNLTASNTLRSVGRTKESGSDAQTSSKKDRPDWRGYSVNETAHITTLSHPTIYRLLGTGKLKSTKILGRRIIHAESVDELMREGAE
jgi:excisionase family DNA binding protein